MRDGIVLLAAVLAAAMVLSAGCLSIWREVVDEGFEGEVGWSVGKDVPLDPNTGEPVEANASVSTLMARTGLRSMMLEIDGRQDDGTIWVETAVQLPDSGTKRVRLAFFVYSEAESFNVLANVVGFLGTAAPSGEADFEVLGQANPGAGWNEFSMEAEVNIDQGGELRAALGITVAWESRLTYFIDDVSVSIR